MSPLHAVPRGGNSCRHTWTMWIIHVTRAGAIRDSENNDFPSIFVHLLARAFSPKSAGSVVARMLMRMFEPLRVRRAISKLTNLNIRKIREEGKRAGWQMGARRRRGDRKKLDVRLRKYSWSRGEWRCSLPSSFEGCKTLDRWSFKLYNYISSFRPRNPILAISCRDVVNHDASDPMRKTQVRPRGGIQQRHVVCCHGGERRRGIVEWRRGRPLF